MVVVLSLSANVQFCLSKMFRTPVTPHATNLLLSEITVWRIGVALKVKVRQSKEDLTSSGRDLC